MDMIVVYLVIGLLSVGVHGQDGVTHYIYALTFFNITTEIQQDNGISQWFISSFEDAEAQIQIKSHAVDRYVQLDASNNRARNFTERFTLSTPIEDGIQNHGVIVVTNNKVNIQGSRSAPGTTDAFLALPMMEESREFFLPSWPSEDVGMAGFAIATASSECVELYKIRNDGEEERLWLMGMSRYDMYQEFDGTIGVDMTGYNIRSTGPLAVYSGNECGQAPLGTRFCDHLIAQIPDITQYGKVSIAPSIDGRLPEATYTIRILAAYNNTIISPPVSQSDVYISQEHGCGCTGARNPSTDIMFGDCTQDCVINRGGFVQLVVQNSLFATMFTCSEPCLVVQYHSSLYAAGKTPLGVKNEPLNPDASMVIITPVDHYSNRMSFATPNYVAALSNPEFVNYATVIVSTNDISGVLYDDQPITAGWDVIDDYSYSSFRITHGFHRLHHADPAVNLGAFVYGHGMNEFSPSGYSFPATYEVFGTTIEGRWHEDIVPVTEVSTVEGGETTPSGGGTGKTCSRPTGDNVGPDIHVQVVGTSLQVPPRCRLALSINSNGLPDTINELICQDRLCPGLSQDIYIKRVNVTVYNMEQNLIMIDVIAGTSMDVMMSQLALCRKQIAAFMTHWNIPDDPTGSVAANCGDIAPTFTLAQQTCSVTG